MSWYDHALQSLEAGRIYARNELTAALRKDRPDLSSNSFRWAIGKMLKSGSLVRVGYDAYLLQDGKPRSSYQPVYSDQAAALISQLAARFPYVRFTVFETALLNEFLNHLIAQNTIFLQVEKDAAIFVFRFLQETGRRDVLYHPSPKEYSLYWEKDCVVVTDLISESPMPESAPHEICLEKILVDLYCDKLISTTYSKAEYEDIVAQSVARYQLDRKKLLRYARRRNKADKLASILDAAGKRE